MRWKSNQDMMGSFPQNLEKKKHYFTSIKHMFVGKFLVKVHLLTDDHNLSMLIYSVYAQMSKPIAKLVHLHSIIIDVTDGTGHHGISYKSEYRQRTVNTISPKSGKIYTFQQRHTSRHVFANVQNATFWRANGCGFAKNCSKTPKI